MKSLLTTLCTVAALAAGVSLAADAVPSRLRVGKARSGADGTVTLPIRFSGQPNGVVIGLSGDVTFDTTVLANPRCDVAGVLDPRRQRGSGVTKTVVCSEPRPGLVRIGIFGLDMGPIPRGTLATLTFDVLTGARPGRHPLTIVPGSSGPTGEDMGVAGRDGYVYVRPR